MLVLGLVLILAAAALGVGVVFDGSEAASVELFGATVDTTIAGVFFAGAAAMLVFMVGVLLLTTSMGRSRRKRVQRKETKRAQRDSVKQLEEERTQLRAENERLAGQLGGRDTTGGTAGTAAADRDRVGTTDADGDRDAATTGDRDRDGTADTAETRSGPPLRESDGPDASGSHVRSETDLRPNETTTAATRGDTTRR
jgi:hypothetical protein